MRVLAVLTLLFAPLALSSLGIPTSKTILWTRNSHENYANTSILYIKYHGGNQIREVSHKEPNKSISSLFTSFRLKNYDSLIEFHLYTWLNKNHSQILYKDNITSIEQSNYVKGKEVIVIFNGYTDNVNCKMTQLIKNTFLERFDYNIIAIDWSGVMEQEWFYWQVAADTQPVGRCIGDFLVFLMKTQFLNISQLHFVGHSLGAHVAGFAGKQIRQLTNESVPRISGLDPALPCFKDKSPNSRLAQTDAKFVDCIHTCGGYLAYSSPICHADFYPNGGVFQPGCSLMADLLGKCSHARAYQYYAESIQKGHYFVSYKCAKLPDFKAPVLCGQTEALMGYPAKANYSGLFYLKTNGKYYYSNMIKTDDAND